MALGLAVRHVCVVPLQNVEQSGKVAFARYFRRGRLAREKESLEERTALTLTIAFQRESAADRF